MEIIQLRDDYIKLGQALKAAGLVENGGEAKEVITSGRVRVNGEVCTQRGKKLHRDDVILFGEEQVQIK